MMEDNIDPKELSIAYPEVFDGADEWLWSDEDGNETIHVTAHGLRRLLRLIAKMQRVVMYDLCDRKRALDPSSPYVEDVAFKTLAAIANNSCAIFCEGSLIASRLFLDDAGEEIVHPNPEVDEVSTRPIAS